MKLNVNNWLNTLYDDAVFGTKSIKDLGPMFLINWFMKSKIKVPTDINLKILIICTPCNGFGDIVFAAKLYSYMKYWYPKSTIKIATPRPEDFEKLGFLKNIIIKLDAGKITQCRRIANLKVPSIPQQDLLLVAPLMGDYDVNLKDVQKGFPYANWWNTYFFSEYNDALNKNFTFNTGVGKTRDGMLFTNFNKIPPKQMKKPYAIAYVAQSLTGLEKCLMAFLTMVAKKYHTKHRDFEVILPPWFIDEDLDNRIRKHISPFYPNIKIVGKKDTIVISEGNGPTLTLRCDILPVPNEKMISLIKYSVEDVLLTGDQSITDALACCSNKNIFYQIAPWKSNLAKELSKLLPNIYLKSVSTSCGSLKAISYKSNYKDFVKKWDFRILAKPKMNAMMLAGFAMQNWDTQHLYDIIQSSRTMTVLRKKMDPENPVVVNRKKGNTKSRRKSRRSRRKSRRSRRKSRRSRRKSRRSRRKSRRKSRKKSRKKYK
jgi:hypothetical protein